MAIPCHCGHVFSAATGITSRPQRSSERHRKSYDRPSQPQCTIPPHQLNHQHAETPSHPRQNEGQPLWSSGSIETQKLAHHRFHKSKIAIWSVTQIKLIPRQLLPLHAPLTPAVFSVM